VSRSFVGIVLAGGRSERASFVKALGRIDGEPLVLRAVRTLKDAGAAHVIVVVAPPHDAAILPVLEQVEVAPNPQPELGMASSLRVGMRAALAHSPDVVVFSLIDHPRVGASTVKRLIEATVAGAVRPKHGATTGHPVAVSRQVAEALAAMSPDRTARDVLERFPLLDLEVDDPGVIDDLDTAEELAAARVTR
jgi:CTP:molybdopterin cytidylyltransferase MocA